MVGRPMTSTRVLRSLFGGTQKFKFAVIDQLMTSSIVRGNRQPHFPVPWANAYTPGYTDSRYLGWVLSLYPRPSSYPHDDGRSFDKKKRGSQERDKSRRETFAAGNTDTRSQLRPSLTGEEEFSPFTASSLLHTEYRETDIFLFCRHSTVVPPPWLTLRVKQEKNYVVSFQTEDGTVNHDCCIVITGCQLSVMLRGPGGPGRSPGEQEQRVAIQGASRCHLFIDGRPSSERGIGFVSPSPHQRAQETSGSTHTPSEEILTCTIFKLGRGW